MTQIQFILVQMKNVALEKRKKKQRKKALTKVLKKQNKKLIKQVNHLLERRELSIMRELLKEFKEFLDEYKVIGLAVAFIMGLAANSLVKSLVDNIVMPLITPFIPHGGWETATLNIWKFSIAWGPFLAALINFVIMAVVIFLLVKFALKKKKVSETK